MGLRRSDACETRDGHGGARARLLAVAGLALTVAAWGSSPARAAEPQPASAAAQGLDIRSETPRERRSEGQKRSSSGSVSPLLSAASLRTSAEPERETSPGSANAQPLALASDDDAVMLRMLASEDVAVPIQDLGDALVTIGSSAPHIEGVPPDPAPSQLPAMATALLPERPAIAQPSMEGLSPLARPASDGPSPADGQDLASVTPENGAARQLGRIVSSVNMRAKPDGSARTVSVLAANAAVTVLGCDYWCEVEADGKRGFVFKRFVQVR